MIFSEKKSVNWKKTCHRIEYTFEGQLMKKIVTNTCIFSFKQIATATANSIQIRFACFGH